MGFKLFFLSKDNFLQTNSIKAIQDEATLVKARMGLRPEMGLSPWPLGSNGISEGCGGTESHLKTGALGEKIQRSWDTDRA